MVHHTLFTTLILSTLLSLTTAQATVTVFECTTSTPVLATTSTTYIPTVVAITSSRPAVYPFSSSIPTFPTSYKSNFTTPATSARLSGTASTSPPTFTGAANALTPVIGLVGLGLGAIAML